MQASTRRGSTTLRINLVFALFALNKPIFRINLMIYDAFTDQ